MNEIDSSNEHNAPGGSRKSRSVQWRIMVRQLPLLFILFVALLYWLENYLEDAFYATNLEFVRRLSTMVVSSVETSMETKEPGRIWDGVEQLLPEDKDTRLKIINKKGVELFSSEPETRGQVHDLSDAPCIPCHVNGSRDAQVQSRFIDNPSGEPYTIFAAPLRNEQNCRSCHKNEGEILGMVYVWHSLSPVHRLVRTIRTGFLIAGAVALFFTILTTRLFLGRYLNKPLRQLVAGARAIGSGDLDQKIHVSERTELSELADTFNISGERLKKSIQEIRNQRDDLQNLYNIADQLSRSIRPEERRQRAVELIGSVFKSDCLIIAGHFHPESRNFHGTVTYREHGKIREIPFSGTDDLPGGAFCSPSIVEQWLLGELNNKFRIRDGSTVAFPLERRGERLGIIMAPARKEKESADGRATAANPEVVKAFIKHLSVALELSELQRKQIKQERLVAIGETIAGLAHCLRNTLNGLRGGQYIVESAMRNDDPEKLEQGWEVLKSGVRQVERLTLDMLFYTTDRKPRLEPVNPNQILNETVDVLEGSAGGKGVSIWVELDGRVRPIPLDRSIFRQAVLYLLTNAIDACVESANGDRVVIKSHDRDKDVLITIEDNGTGMDENTTKRVFDRFFSTKFSKGIGLGLPVVKKIVEAHKGDIEVQSTPGLGTIFYLKFPKS